VGHAQKHSKAGVAHDWILWEPMIMKNS